MTTVNNIGLVDDGITGYEIKSEHSYLRYGHEPHTRIFYLYNIGTPNPDDRGKGYAKEVLEEFFKIIKKSSGMLDVGHYTRSGELYVKHVVERLAKHYGIKLI